MRLLMLFCALLLFLQWEKSSAKTELCERGWFPCDKSWSSNQSDIPFCIHQRKICDRKRDCPDGEDEENCVDVEGDDEHLMAFLNRSFIPEEDFHKCELETPPDFCNCRQYTRISCQHSGLDSVPQNLDPNLSHLYLGNNSLLLSKSSFERYSFLRLLELDYNVLSSIPNLAFQPLIYLRYLMMNNNNFSFFPCEAFGNSKGLESLSIANNNFTSFDDILECLPNLTELNLDFNQIDFQRIDSKLNHHGLQVLFLENNGLETFFPSSFIGLSELTSLYLRSNRIRAIHSEAFQHLPNLVALDLSYNLVKVFSSNSLSGLESLRSLELKGNPISEFHRETFIRTPKISSINFEEIEMSEGFLQNISSINGSFAYFKRFRYCSYLPHIRNCSPKTDGVSSFDQLLVRTGLRIGVWLVAGVTLTGNVLVLLGRSLTREEHKVVSLFIRNLAVADLFTGIYLAIIGTKDLLLRDVYHEFAYEWMSSWHCTLSGLLAFISCEVSVFLLTVMSLERWICITWPLQSSLLSLTDAKKILVALWAFGGAIAIAPIFWYRRGGPGFYGSNGMCFPIHLEDPWIPGWVYSAVIIIGLNSLGVIIIIISYASMFWSIRMTHADTPLSLGNRDLAFRFFFIVVTDCLSWIPIITLKILALKGHEMSADVYAVVVVILLPINSALNPWLYTFTTSKFRSQATNLSCSWLSSWKRSDLDSESTKSSSLKHGPNKFGYSSRNRKHLVVHSSSSSGKSVQQTSFCSYPHSILKKRDDNHADPDIDFIEAAPHILSEFD